MADSLLDEAIRACRDALDESDLMPGRSDLSARLGILERAVWSLGLERATQDQVVALAKLVLTLRDDVLSARPPRSCDPAAPLNVMRQCVP